MSNSQFEQGSTTHSEPQTRKGWYELFVVGFIVVLFSSAV